MIPDVSLDAMRRFEKLADSMMLYVSVGELRGFVEALFSDVKKAEQEADSPLRHRELVFYGYMRHAVERWCRPAEHTHVDRMDGSDTCAACGRDIRDEIHERMAR